ncbi:hypothetical protein O988_00202 [Pseudogymnoascus sp. VKM F-3808]|nr:hypothetical protein O988_00202 [Pseudogymnoascus sp. VKM F-3808]
MDLEYNMASFIRDLPNIRKQTFKKLTIILAFQKAAMLALHKRASNWLTSTEEVLALGQLQQLDLQLLQRQVEEQKKGKNRSRAQLQVGAQKTQAKEAQVAWQATNQVRRQLRRLGVEARKQERLRKKRVRALTRAGNPIPPEDYDPIPGPKTEPGFERGGFERGVSEREPEPGF